MAATANTGEDLVIELNRRRALLGLKPAAYDPAFASLAEACARRNLVTAALTHCGYEVLWRGQPGATASDILGAWWKSPPHFAVLTAATLTLAGGSVVAAGRTAVAALHVNY